MADTLAQSLLQGEQAGARYALLPPREAAIGQAGTRLANRPGSSIEFMDHREYQPGDDIRRIDWSAYARSDRLMLRLYREEVSPHVDLLLDTSRSMNLAGSDKAPAAAGLAAALAAAASNSGLTHMLYLAGDRIQPLPTGRQPATAWSRIDFVGSRPLPEALAAGHPRWRRQGIRVLISDLMFPADPMRTLRQIAQDAAAVVVIEVLGQSDIDPPAHGNLRLVDAETQQVRELFIDAAVQQRYRRSLHAHRSRWQQACGQVGAKLVRLVAEPLLTRWDLASLVRAEVLRVA